ncbi:hypothetical protein LTR08_008659 [Meristemomyces frigidus]|nr:hypothetical protein LTR08_008659 [Meristemomyces frigidus]
MSARLSRPYIEDVPLPVEEPSEARYYQDPEARRQLRHYLTSVRNFDEAIEFGFPSPDRITPSPYSTDPSSPIWKGFSPPGPDGDDASLSSYDPPTPTAIDYGHPVVVPSASFDSGIALPLQLNTHDKPASDNKNNHSRSSSSFGGDREMTLRMTLTRPELRLSEKEVNSWQRMPSSGGVVTGVDPLALESLPVCDDATGAHGAFAVRCGGREKGLRKVWKNLRRS